jgi:hypothetical protein
MWSAHVPTSRYYQQDRARRVDLDNPADVHRCPASETHNSYTLMREARTDDPRGASLSAGGCGIQGCKDATHEWSFRPVVSFD